MSRRVDTLRWKLLARIDEILDRYDSDNAWRVIYDREVQELDGEMVIELRNDDTSVGVNFYLDISESETVRSLLEQIEAILEEYLQDDPTDEFEAELAEANAFLLDHVFSPALSGLDEDKQVICDALCEAYQAARGAYDLQRLEYDAEKEIVYVVFEGGTKRINVAMDSGTAMIKDIANNIGC